MTHRSIFLVLACAALSGACAEVQRIPDEPRYTAPSSDRRAEPKPAAEQRVAIAVRRVELPPPAPVTQAALAASAATEAVRPAIAQAASPVTQAASAATEAVRPAFAHAASTVTQAALAASAATEAVRPAFAQAASTMTPALPRVQLLEARLAAVPACNEMLIERMDGVRPIRQELGQEDKILMWSAYGGAGLVAVLTSIGMARGQDPGRGVLLFGIYGLPLAAVGGYETWRMRTLEEPVEPRYSASRQVGELPCPKGSDSLPARVVLAPDRHTDLYLSREWTAVPGGERLAARYDAETEAPTRLRDGRLTAFLGVTPPADEAPAPATSASPAPVAADAVTAAVPCVEAAVQTASSGWLPKAFFAQPVKDAELRDGVALEAFAEEQLGGKQYLWQVQELNPGLKQALQGQRPVKVKVPVQVKSASDWKTLLPQTCE